MKRHTISLPDPMSDYIDTRMNAGQFGNVSEYFRDLVRKDQEQQRTAIDTLRGMIDSAEASGVSERSVADVFAEARRRAKSQGLVD